MGYQLVVWEGEKPESDALALERCSELMSTYFVGEGEKPTPAIAEFVAALTAIWPDDGSDFDAVPWKFPPLIDDASGPVLFLNMRFGMGEQVSFRIAEMAEERGLVTFDTYIRVMRPCPKNVVDRWNRQQWAHVVALLSKQHHGAS